MVTTGPEWKSKPKRGTGHRLTGSGRPVIIRTPPRSPCTAPRKPRRPTRILPMPNEPVPSVVAMLVCDQVISEQGTNKKSLIGVFDNFYSLVFPAALPRIAVYVKLADAQGDYLFKLRFVNLRDESRSAFRQRFSTVENILSWLSTLVCRCQKKVSTSSNYTLGKNICIV